MRRVIATLSRKAPITIFAPTRILAIPAHAIPSFARKDLLNTFRMRRSA
jgi:hypothetical protein